MTCWFAYLSELLCNVSQLGCEPGTLESWVKCATNWAMKSWRPKTLKNSLLCKVVEQCYTITLLWYGYMINWIKNTWIVQWHVALSGDTCKKCIIYTCCPPNCCCWKGKVLVKERPDRSSKIAKINIFKFFNVGPTNVGLLLDDLL